MLAALAVNAGDPDSLYYACDGGNELWKINRADGGRTQIGDFGVPNIEAITYWSGNQTLYGTNAGDFGTISKTTGAFSFVGEVDGGGTANGAAGPQSLNDVDGLSFDPWTGILWASNRRGGNYDLLFHIDPSTGQFVPNAFGPGIDYIVIDGSGVYLDIDDIAVSPINGQMYTIATQAPDAQVLKINKTTGAVTAVVAADQPDVEGLAYHNDGSFWGTVGTQNEFWQIDPETGVMSNMVDVNHAQCSDPEGTAALVADANVVTGKVWDDVDYNGIINGGEVGIAGITVELYYDQDADGVLDPSDVLIQTDVTDASGDFLFHFATTASLIIKVNEATVPPLYSFTTDNKELAVFADAVNFGELDANNNFGIATGPDFDGDGIPDFSEATGDSDSDGIPDYQDLDSDNDGILDSVEGITDSDGDGKKDYRDRDSDNDGIPDALEANGGIALAEYNSGTGNFIGPDSDSDGLLDVVDNAPAVAYGAGSTSTLPDPDTDGDGVVDRHDKDSDNDGIMDISEAGGTDVDGDGAVDSFSDVDLDGYHDPLATTPLPIPNTDASYETTYSLPLNADYLDYDADGDGITDNVEGFSTADFTEPSIIQDLDNDGVIDFFDLSMGGSPIVPEDTDNDGTPDFQDLDTDGDGVNDDIEGNDADLNGVADTSPSGSDSDGDGIDDTFDVDCSTGGGGNAYNGNASDYAEEDVSDGSIYLTSSDLELADEAGGQGLQEVGVRFTGVNIPQGKTITSAYIQFQADESGSGAVSLNIYGEDTDNSTAFTSTAYDVSNRTKTSASVAWSPPGWTAPNAGPNQQTPDLTAIIQEIIDRPGWNSGNTLAIIINGTGTRTAEVNPTLVIDTAGGAANTWGCGTNVPLQNEDSDAEPDWRDLYDANNPGIFYYVCDGSNELWSINHFTGSRSLIGGTGVGVIEAIAYWPGSNTLYAANAGDFGTLNTSTGTYTSIGNIDGAGCMNGAQGCIPVNDVDGLSFDPWTGILWASERRGADFDVMFQIDPVTGQYVQDAFGAGIDYIVIDGSGVYDDVDDIAVSPTNGQMYTIGNDGVNDQILNVNKNTGAVSVVAGATENDVEGMAYYNDGTFWGTVGTQNEFWEIDPLTGVMTDVVSLAPGCGDPEALAALVAPANTVTGTLWDDLNFNGILEGGEPPLAGVTVLMYYDVNKDSLVDPGDLLIQSAVTDAGGNYSFDFAASGNVVLEVDLSTLPAGYALTTDNIEFAVFEDNVNFNELDPNNNFGAATGPDCDGDGIPDFAEGAGDADGDGVPNMCDLDSDNDGILDAVELQVDTDGDGIFDLVDKDSDNDGIPDALEANYGIAIAQYNPATGSLVGPDADGDGLIDAVDSAPAVPYGASASTFANPDSDGDGINDNRDRDSDNDGILDLVEAGGDDTDTDGIVDGFVDTDNDGYDDNLMGSPLAVPNTDTGYETTYALPQRPDYIDMDADGDGIADAREGQATFNYQQPSLIVDADGDGVIDFWDVSFDGLPIVPQDLDADGTPDFRDDDTDNDSVTDIIEGNDANFDGVADSAPSGTDADGDGIDDTFDTDGGTAYGGESNVPLQNFDASGEVDFRDVDDDDDGITTINEPLDINPANGTPDYLETSPCGAGFAQVTTTVNGNVLAWSNNNGVVNPDNVIGPFNTTEANFNAGDEIDFELEDVVDANEVITIRGRKLSGGNARMWVSQSIDGVAWINRTSITLSSPTLTDHFYTLSAANDAKYIKIERRSRRFALDAMEYNFNTVTCEPDFDNDGIANVTDIDDDNDGIPDIAETSGDFDGDGITNEFDLDSDNDGIPDAVEANSGVLPANMGAQGQYPAWYVILNDATGNGLADDVDPVSAGFPLPDPDSDLDGLKDRVELDSDGDGITDGVEANDGSLPANMDDNGQYPAAYASANDADGDGIVDDIDPDLLNPLPPNPDNDGDGTPDYLDLDSDGDLLADNTEGFSSPQAPLGTDCDNDGIDDRYDPDCGGSAADLPDGDNDGTPDYLDKCAISAQTGDWNDVNTWVDGSIPDQDDCVVILSGHTVDLTGVTPAGSITINTGGTLVDNTNTLTLVGDLDIDGTFTNDGETVMEGTTPQNIMGSGTLNDLTIDNPSTVNITGGNTTVKGTLKAQQGTLNITVGDTLILGSDASGTANVSGEGTGIIAGIVKMERHVGGCEDYLYLSSPFSGLTLTEWYNYLWMQGFTGVNYPAAQSNVYTYDETVAGVQSVGFTEPTNVTNPIDRGLGYFMYVWATDLPTLVAASGTVNLDPFVFPITYTVTAFGNDNDGWNFLGNPYPANIDWYAPAGWTKINCCDAIYTFDRCASNYAGFVDGLSVNGGSQYVASSQAFYIKVHSPGASVSCTRDVMVDEDVPIKSNDSIKNALKMLISGVTGYTDEIAVRFRDQATDAFDPPYDALKLFTDWYEVPQIYSVSDVGGKCLDFSINAFPELTEDRKVKLKIKVGVSGDYQLDFSGMSSFDDNTCIFLEDSITGMWTDVRSTATYSFHQDADTVFKHRFNLHFAAPIETVKEDVSCDSGQLGHIIAEKKGKGPFTYVWLNEAGDTVRLAANVNGPDTLSQLTAGKYRVMVDNAICSQVQETEIITPMLVNAGFTTQADVIYLDEDSRVFTTNNSSGATLYTWDFGDGSPKVYQIHPYHTYQEPGTYTITLTASNMDCEDIHTHTVEVTHKVPTFVEPVSSSEAEDFDESANGGVSIYSVEELVYVKVRFTNKTDLRIEVVNLLGQTLDKTILDANVDSKDYTIDLSDVPTGLYMVRLSTLDQEHVRKVFIGKP